jgi:hypothetical protein
MTIIKCNVCQQKKGRRNCPALKQLICPTCCGEHKEKVQDCPNDCIFLIESEHFKEQKHYEEMSAKSDRVKRDILNGEGKYSDLMDNIENAIYKKVSDDENFEDEHITNALLELMDNYMSRKPKLIEDDEDIKLGRTGSLKSDIQDSLRSFITGETPKFEYHEVAACLDMIKLMVEAQKSTSETPDEKRHYIKALIESKKEKEKSDAEGSQIIPPDEVNTEEVNTDEVKIEPPTSDIPNPEKSE